MGKKLIVMGVPGKRRRRRPKLRWLENIRNDLSDRKLSWEEAPCRVKWRRLIINIDLHINMGKDTEEENNMYMAEHVPSMFKGAPPPIL